jgi:hypothetical protein
MRAEDAGEDFGPATNAMTPVDGFNRPPDQTSALTQRSTMEGIAAVRFELEAMVARAEQRPRDEFQALEKMRTAARRPSFAEALLVELEGAADGVDSRECTVTLADMLAWFGSARRASEGSV